MYARVLICRLELRIKTWFTAFLDAHMGSEAISAKQAHEARILITSHGAWINSFCRVLQSDDLQARLAPGVDLASHAPNTATMRVRCALVGDRWEIEILSYGDMSHLQDVKEPNLEVVDDL